MTSYAKAKSATKQVEVRSPRLNGTVLETMDKIAAIVGATLGPGGAAVLIERQEFGLAPIVSKDGVTVFQSLGFDDPVAHAVMEAARDAAVKTVTEAGDGTTTATVLAAALVRYAQQYHDAHPETPPQRIAERLRELCEDLLVPRIHDTARKVDMATAEGQKVLHAVASISANGDTKLADAVLECFEQVGDQGTVTISERSGPPGYAVEKIEGYPIGVGYEDSCTRFVSIFLNEPENNRVFLRKPYFILYNGMVADCQSVLPLLDRLQMAWDNRPGPATHDPTQPFLTDPNVVLVANGFSEQTLATLAANWRHPASINVLPLVTPRSILQNGEAHFLEDLAAITGGEVLDPLQKNFDAATIPNQGDMPDIGQVDGFEMLRFRSTVFGHADDDLIVDRAEILEGMASSSLGELDARVIRERLAALTGGIAKLWVIGGSQGELRERRDRADDAVRAVQGALRHGVLPGGGWMLMQLSALIEKTFGPESLEFQVLGRALHEPTVMLLGNTGLGEQETGDILSRLARDTEVWDAARRQWCDAYAGGILDSVPAVREAIRNSISIAGLLGTLGGVVVFKRDVELERREAQSTNDYMRDTGMNDFVNERAS